MSDPNLNLGVGGGQPPLGGPSSLDDDEKAMKKGRGAVLAVGIILAVLVAGGLVALLAMMGQPDQYGTIGRQINGMKRDHFDRFWTCALPQQRLETLRSDQDLRTAINTRASRNPDAYVQHVRTECMVNLTEHEHPSTLVPPEDLNAQLAELGTALDNLKLGWEEYLTTVEAAETYDEEALSPQLSKIAKGWYDYRRAHVSLNNTIREQRED